MNISDPIADMLTRIRNASRARHEEVCVPASRTKLAIAQILKDEGFIEDFDECSEGSRQFLRITPQVRRQGARRVAASSASASPACASTPAKTEIPRVLGGLGVVIVSTSQGIMTGAAAAQGASSAAKSWPTSGKSRCHVSAGCPSRSRPAST